MASVKRMFVTKRNKAKEPVFFDKITTRLMKLADDLNDIDPSLVTQKICNSIYSGISTYEVDILASQICMSMSIDNPDYSILAGRIVISNHQKNTEDHIWNVTLQLMNNIDFSGKQSCILDESYIGIVEKYKDELQKMICMDRDYLIDYFGFKTLEKSYLLRTSDKQIVERPQHLFLRVAIGIHGDDLKSVHYTYDNLSKKNYTHATPTLFNCGLEYATLLSCFLLGTNDSIEGIFETITDSAQISKASGGCGIHISNIRSNGAYIRKTGGYSDGIVPMLKVYNDVARYINQGGGKRNGSFAMYIEPHHADIFEFLEAKKNTGADEHRARDLFYALWIPDLFMIKVETNDDWYLMNPDVCQGLPEVFGEEYNKLYQSYVDVGKYVKKIKARELWEAIIASQIEHGLPYMSYKDHVNRKNNQSNIGVIKSSNLCNEINQYSDSEEIACCNLASICLSNILEIPDSKNSIKTVDWFKLLTKDEQYDADICLKNTLYIYTKNNCSYCHLLKQLFIDSGIIFVEIGVEEAQKKQTLSGLKFNSFTSVPQVFVDIDATTIKYLGGYNEMWSILKPRINHEKLAQFAFDLTINLNKIIDKNVYPVEKAKLSNLRHRPIGIGVQGLANLFMMLKIPFTSEEAQQINKDIFESIYYGAMSSSLMLVKKDGQPFYSTFNGSHLSKGKFQFNLWGKDDSDLSGRWDWGALREQIMLHGVRNSLLIALMPTASTSSIFNNIEGTECITSNMYTRNVMSGVFTIINKHLVKDLKSLKLWNQDTIERLVFDKGSVQNLKDLPLFLKEVYRTVYETNQKGIIKMSADRGLFVCQSQSLNLFFDKPTFKEITSAHFYGWKLGLKTGMYYLRTKSGKSAQNFALDVKTEKKLLQEKIDKECLSCSA